MTTPAPSPSASLWRRLAVTVVGAAAVTWASHVPLPALDPHAIGSAYFNLNALEPSLVIGSVGLTSVLVAFVFVEILALIVPAWRPLRFTPQGRTQLARASLWVGGALALLQAGLIGWVLHAMVREPSGLQLLLHVGSLAGFTAFALWTAYFITRAGLGNGFGAILTATVGAELARGSYHLAGLIRARVLPASPATVGLPLAVLAGLVVATYWMLRHKRRSGGPIPLRVPASGATPAFDAATGVHVLVSIGTLGGMESLLRWRGQPPLLVHLALAAAYAGLWAILFHRPRRVAAVWKRAQPERPVTTDDIAASLRPAVGWSLLIALVLVLADRPWALGRLMVSSTFLVVAVAYVLDLQAEWRFRREHADAVAVWPACRVYAIDPALDRLQAANIPALAQHVHFRVTTQFFAPYVPIQFLVPARHVEAATVLLGHALLPGQPPQTQAFD